MDTYENPGMKNGLYSTYNERKAKFFSSPQTSMEMFNLISKKIHPKSVSLNNFPTINKPFPAILT
jgi:hypothetical protein